MSNRDTALIKVSMIETLVKDIARFSSPSGFSLPIDEEDFIREIKAAGAVRQAEVDALDQIIARLRKRHDEARIVPGIKIVTISVACRKEAELQTVQTLRRACQAIGVHQFDPTIREPVWAENEELRKALGK